VQSFRSSISFIVCDIAVDNITQYTHDTQKREEEKGEKLNSYIFDKKKKRKTKRVERVSKKEENIS
jgi:hypothetical protein